MFHLINKTERQIPESDLKKIYRIIKTRFEILKNVEINLILMNNNEIQKLNRKYRNIDKETDVLSFLYDDEKFLIPGGTKMGGEIFISLEKVASQAKEYKVSFESELNKNFIHGFLHILGFEHDNDNNFKKMEKMEEIVQKAYLKEEKTGQ